MGILLPEEDAISILELEIAPMGVADHLRINTLREYIPKMRVTNDLSFPGIKSKELLNSRVDKNKLKLIMFGSLLVTSYSPNGCTSNKIPN